MLKSRLCLVSNSDAPIVSLTSGRISYVRKKIQLPWIVDDEIEIPAGKLDSLLRFAYVLVGVRPCLGAATADVRSEILRSFDSEEMQKQGKSIYDFPVVKMPVLDEEALANILAPKNDKGKPTPLSHRQMVHTLASLPKKTGKIPSVYAVAEPFVVAVSAAANRVAGASAFGFEISRGLNSRDVLTSTFGQIGEHLAPIYGFSLKDWLALPAHPSKNDPAYSYTLYDDASAFLANFVARKYPGDDLRGKFVTGIRPIRTDLPVEVVE